MARLSKARQAKLEKFILANPDASARAIARATGVSRPAVTRFLAAFALVERDEPAADHTMPGETPFDARLRETIWSGVDVAKWIAAQPAEHLDGYAAALAKRKARDVEPRALPDWDETDEQRAVRLELLARAPQRPGPNGDAEAWNAYAGACLALSEPAPGVADGS